MDPTEHAPSTGAPAAPPTGGDGLHLLEEGARLSRSVLWRGHRAFYERAGPVAWSFGVIPHYITSNPTIAAAYARVLAAWLTDLRRLTGAAALRLDQPIHIVELGAGAGRFGFHLLAALREELARPSLAGLRVRLVMTDFAESNLAAWAAHPSLRSLVAEGLLDFARFDATRDTALRLVESGEVLAPGEVANPVAVIANYVFDSLPHDAFRLAGGRLHERLVTVRSRVPLGDGAVLDDPALLCQVELDFADREIEARGYYPDPALGALLEGYRTRLADTVFELPVGAVECVRALSTMAGGRLLLLAADRGALGEEELLDRDRTRVEMHGGCVSLAMNFHALGEYIGGLGGRVLRPAHRPEHLAIAGYLLGAAPDGGWGETEHAFHAAVGAAGPDDAYSLLAAVREHFGALSLGELLALLRLARADGAVLVSAAPAILSRIPAAGEGERRELREVIRQAWSGHLPIGEPRGLAYSLGLLHAELGDHEEAIRFFEQARPDAEVVTRIAACLERQRRPREALARVEEALSLDPDWQPARALRLRLLP